MVTERRCREVTQHSAGGRLLVVEPGRALVQQRAGLEIDPAFRERMLYTLTFR